MLEKSEVKGAEYQDDPYIHNQSFPERIPEEQEIYPDDNGRQQQYIKYGGHADSHLKVAIP